MRRSCNDLDYFLLGNAVTQSHDGRFHDRMIFGYLYDDDKSD